MLTAGAESATTLDDTAFLPVLAHELGHATLGHESYWRARQQRELDANARAVEILVRVLKKTEPEAGSRHSIPGQSGPGT
jgi:hypothetical protein